MVVVVIIGVLITVASFSIGDRAGEALNTETQRLQQLLSLALEEAETKGVQIGFRYTAEGYEFLAIDADGKWAVIEDQGPLRARELEQPLELKLRVDGQLVPPAVSREFAPDAPITPQVLLLSSGELTPFLLWIAIEKKPESGQILQGSLTGEFTVEPWSRNAWSERAAKTTS